jgi:hypothetical protein
MAHYNAEDLFEISRTAFGQASSPVEPPMLLGPSYVAARRHGRRLSADWHESGSLIDIMARLKERHPEATTVELCLGDRRHRIGAAHWQSALGNQSRGRLGLEFRWAAHRHVVAPTVSIASNRSLRREFDIFLQRIGLSEQEYRARGGTIHAVECRQFILEIGQGCTELFRGDIVIPPSEWAVVEVDEVLRRMRDWFLANQTSDGGIPYKYWPSRGAESEADNPIRRFLATIAMTRLGRAFHDTELIEGARRNLEYNLQRFYKNEGALGLIEWNGSVKLGAVALAGLAILEHPSGDCFESAAAALLRTVLMLRSEDSRFRTFYKPPTRNDNQNFYPGEALLFLSAVYGRDPQAVPLQIIEASLQRYRSHFLSSMNPAFVPWHTQACCLLSALTGELKWNDYVFQMNDWLIGLQQWGPPLAPDLWGRFYDPARPEYGPPHASSTGVYLEGLSDALLLALAAKESGRATEYRKAIVRGIRSVAQLQFRGAPQTFYISKPERVLGAIRTESYNNELRVDNLQHCAMALLKYRKILTAHGPREGLAWLELLGPDL